MVTEPQPNRFSRLPARIRLEDTITTCDVDPVPDPERGHDTDRDFLIRYGLFGL
ncbi:MAG: hypothetical protein QOJ72_1673 [Nocardioidaceae bacterium]|jgi:hypothetical protein|nr:hypothetical protein [Nocardioidaceae bacterium]